MIMRVLILLFCFALTSVSLFGQSVEEGIRALRMGNTKKGLGMLAKLANNGDLEALYQLSKVFLEPIKGSGMKKNVDKYVKLINIAANKGHPLAQYDLGCIFKSLGGKKPENYKKAKEYFIKAANKGLVAAQLELGIQFAIGQITKRDYSQAAKWYEKAAKQGSVQAMYSLGHMYFDGQHFSKNLKKGFRYIKEAAELGFPIAQSQIGRYYLFGEIVKKNQAKAFYWLEKAADQGWVNAHWLLAKLYSQSKPDKAGKHGFAAALGGCALAQFDIANAAWEGKKFEDSYFWAVIAAKSIATGIGKNRQYAGNLNSYLEFRKKVEKKLTSKKVQRIRANAKEWLRTHPSNWL